MWTGVPLHEILKRAGISHDNKSFAYEPNKYHIRFASEHDKGGDKLPAGIYGTSVPLEKAWDPSQDIIVAFMYNGKLLSPDHGFPVRVIIPGFIGGRMIKWLTNIDLIETISQDYFHFFDNRVLPPHVDAEMAKAEGWWFKPEYICNDLSVNSAIACPAHDEQLRIDVPPEEGGDSPATYAVRGYAYTGGGRRISRVEVSLNSGAVWQLADLEVTERPSRFGKYWCWVFWRINLPIADIAAASEIVLRAWDEGHNTQPDKPTWNLMGMLNNPWFRIKIHRVPGCDDKISFEHPTLAGTQPGGWMARLKEHPSLTVPGTYVDPAAANMLVPIPAVAPVAAVEVPIPFDPTKPSFSMAEVREHASDESAWIVVKGQVYDSTPFLKSHPGGADSILIEAGTDCTDSFEAVHSTKAWKMLEKYHIGQLRPADADEAGAGLAPKDDVEVVEVVKLDANGRKIALFDRKQMIPFALSKKEQLSPDTFLLRFSLQSPEHVLGLPVGQHMLFSAKVDGKTCMRAYTPTSSDHDIGHFDLVIKVYFPTAQHPQGGKMSQHLGKMQVGDTIDVKGPLGHVTYLGGGVLRLDKESHSVQSFSMLCGGTGITPIYQVLCAVLRDPADKTVCRVLFANRAEQDILLKSELDALAVAHPERLHVRYILSSPSASASASSWKGDVGRVNQKLVESFFPKGGHNSGHFALLCGPEGFLSDACSPALLAHGYPESTLVYF